MKRGKNYQCRIAELVRSLEFNSSPTVEAKSRSEAPD